MNWRRVAFFVIYAAAFGAAAYYLRSLSVALWGLIGFVALAFIMGPVRRLWRSLMLGSVSLLQSDLENVSLDLWRYVASGRKEVNEKNAQLSALGNEMFQAARKGKKMVYPSDLPFDLFLFFMPRYVFDMTGIEVGDAALRHCRIDYTTVQPSLIENPPQAISYRLFYPIGHTHNINAHLADVYRYFDSIRCGYTGLRLNVSDVSEQNNTETVVGKKGEVSQVEYRWLSVRLVSEWVDEAEAQKALVKMRSLYRDESALPEHPVRSVMRGTVDFKRREVLDDGPFIPSQYPNGHLRDGYIYFGDKHLDDGEPYFVPVKKLTHFLVSGMSGSGKSVFLHQFLAGVAHNERFFDDVYLIDLKGGVELWRYEGKANGLFHVAYQFEKVVELVDGLNELMDERLEEMRERGIRDWDGGKVLVVIDEYAELSFEMPEDREGKAIKQRLLARLSRLSSKARAAGILLWAQLQKGTTDVMDSSFRNNLQSEVMFKPKTKLIAAQVFGSTEELKIDPTRLPAGHFVMFDGATGELVYLKSRMVREMM